MKLKNWISLLLCGALLTGLLAGCGRKENPDPTVKWINTTYAILTKANNCNVDWIGGYAKTEKGKELVLSALDEWWEVTDRSTADENLDWLLDEGHRAVFMDEMATLRDEGYLEMSDSEARLAFKDMEFDDDTAACYIAMMALYKEKGDHAIDAWDYCRALQLLGWYYLADFYTKEEALDKSLEIAKLLQAQYGSWEELCESYLAGYNYWMEDDPSDPDSATADRRSVYDQLKSQKNSPYSLDFNTALEKTW